MRRLFGNQRDRGKTLPQVRGNRKQQRTRTGDNDRFASDIKTRFHQRLQAAGTVDTRQRPARERQESFAGAARQYHLAVTDHQRSLKRLRDQRTGSYRTENLGVHDQRVRMVLKPSQPRSRTLSHGLNRIVPPDLAAGARIVVDDGNPRPRLPRATRRRDSRRARADDQDIDIDGLRLRPRYPCRLICASLVRRRRLNRHTGPTQHLARSLMRHAVDRQSALEADAHAAEWAARLSGHRMAKRRSMRLKHTGCDAPVGRGFDRLTIDAQRESLRHGRPFRRIVSANKATQQSPVSGPGDGTPSTPRCRAKS